MAKEPIPTKEYILHIGDYFLSAGKTILYRVTSGASCKIYWQEYNDPDLTQATRDRLNWVEDRSRMDSIIKTTTNNTTTDTTTDTTTYPANSLVAITPWKTESAWYEKEPGNWTRNGANYPSYEVEILDPYTLEVTSQTSLTLRWIPVTGSADQLITIIEQAKSNFRDSPVRPNVEGISKLALERMKEFSLSSTSKSNVNLEDNCCN
jgi:hypothetical protein